MRGFVFNAFGNTMEIRLTKICIADCAHSGDCEVEVAEWVNKLRRQLNKIPTETIAAVLRPYGAYDEEELKDSEQNLHRLIWLAATQCKEEKSCWAYMDGY